MGVVDCGTSSKKRRKADDLSSSSSSVYQEYGVVAGSAKPMTFQSSNSNSSSGNAFNNRTSSNNKRRALTVSTNMMEATSSSLAASASSSSSMPISSTKVSSSSHETFYAEYCEIPYTLRTILVDEAEKIQRKGFDSMRYEDVVVHPWHRPARSVHVLPARVTVLQVLQQYQKKRGGSSAASDSASDNNNNNNNTNNANKQKYRQVRKFVNGLAALFDDALPVCLLYEQERPQYDALQNDEEWKLKRPCEIYGCTFLLRLIMRLPILLRAEPHSEMLIMGPMIADLIVLLQKNRKACFQEESSYREPTSLELLPIEMKRLEEYKLATAVSAIESDAEDDGDNENNHNDQSFMSES